MCLWTRPWVASNVATTTRAGRRHPPRLGCSPVCIDPSFAIRYGPAIKNTSFLASLTAKILVSFMSLRQAPCDLCGQSDFHSIAQVDRRGNPLVTVVCRACGLISHEKIPSDQELADYYRENYRSDYHGEYTPSPYRVVREWNRGRELLRLLTPYLRRGETVFEIGSGIGCSVKNFECAGYDALGVEPGDGFRSFAADRLGATVLPGVLNDLPGEPLGDMALLVHVLEHLNSPTQALQHIRKLLHPGGRLYIEVPNAAAPHAAPGKMFH